MGAFYACFRPFLVLTRVFRLQMRQGGHAMTKKARQAAGVAVVVAVLGWTSSAAATESSAAVASQESLMAPDPRVRSASPRVVAVIIEAAAQSKTFRGLVDWINTTDGVVYVEEGQCGHGVRACLLMTMTISGPNRLLQIRIDPRKADRDFMASIGHELQHAVEVLSNPTIRSSSRMILLFHRTGNDWGDGFETAAALKAGLAVREELQKSAAGHASAQTPAFFQFLDIETLVAVRLAVEGATTRLARPGCQDLFADFADESGQRLSTRLVATGKPPADAFASLRFLDDRGAQQCRSSGTLAFTRTGSWFIRVCGEQFRHAFQRNPTATEIIVIHEFLHALGLGENPPTSQAITEQVNVRCGD
jgi:hypothetical protein